MAIFDVQRYRESGRYRQPNVCTPAVAIKTRVVRVSQLAQQDLQLWSRFQQADPALASPYFRPEFTQAVAAVRRDVEVAVLQQHGEPVGFFPFQRGPWNIGKPVGGRLSDFHGVIARQGLAWNAKELIRDCGLTAWCFTHLITTQQAFRPHQMTEGISPYLDLSDGFDSYLATRVNRESDELRKASRKAQRLESEYGSIRFEPHTADRQVIHRLMTWKSAQYRSTGFTDVFAYPWTVALLQRILGQNSGLFAGMLSSLYAGNQLAAVQFGMRSAGVLHIWFTAYNHEFAKYSPGLILLVRTAQAAPCLRIHRIDLGKGSERFKRCLMSDAVTVAEGAVECTPLVCVLRRSWRSLRDWVYASPLRKPARLPIRLVRRLREWWSFR